VGIIGKKAVKMVTLQLKATNMPLKPKIQA